MTSYLDIRTLSAVNAIIGLLIGLVMLYVYGTRKTYPGFGQWVVGGFLMFGGMLLMSLRNALPDFITVIVANAAIAAYFTLVASGLYAFLKTPFPTKLFASALLLVVLLLCFFTYVTPDIGARVIVMSAYALALSAISAHCVYFEAPKVIKTPNYLLVASLLVELVFYAFRIVHTLRHERLIGDFMTASSVHGLTMLVIIGANIALVLGLIVINGQRVELELTEALKEIKSLRGVIPICMHCKKIRDDRGVWNQLEAYISKHSEAQFSHGICEACMKQHYPE